MKRKVHSYLNMNKNSYSTSVKFSCGTRGICYWMLTFSVWRQETHWRWCVCTRTTLAGWQRGLNSIKSVQMHLFKLIRWHTDTLHWRINNEQNHFYCFSTQNQGPSFHCPVSTLHIGSWIQIQEDVGYCSLKPWFSTCALYPSFVCSAVFCFFVLKLIIVGQMGPNAHTQSVSVTAPPPQWIMHIWMSGWKIETNWVMSVFEDNRFCVCFSDFFIITAAAPLLKCCYNATFPHKDTHKIISFLLWPV